MKKYSHSIIKILVLVLTIETTKLIIGRRQMNTPHDRCVVGHPIYYQIIPDSLNRDGIGLVRMDVRVLT
jgi:hypothetical protein